MSDGVKSTFYSFKEGEIKYISPESVNQPYRPTVWRVSRGGRAVVLQGASYACHFDNMSCRFGRDVEVYIFLHSDFIGFFFLARKWQCTGQTRKK